MAKPTAVDGVGGDTPLGEAAGRLVLARLMDVRRYQQAVLATRGEDDVHDMRVAARRLRAALALLARGRRVQASCRKVARRVKRLQDALGAVRDLHVQTGLVGRVLGEAGEAGLAAAALAAEGRARLPDREAALVAALGKWEARTVPRVLGLLDGLAARGRLGGGFVLARLDDQVARIERAARQALRGAIAAGDAHRLRILVKKLRYQLELVDRAVPGAEALLGELPELQETLGDLHDHDVLIERMEGLAECETGAVKRGALEALARLADERAGLAEELGREIEELLAAGWRTLLEGEAAVGQGDGARAGAGAGPE